MATEKDINRHVTALIVVIDVYPQMIREMIVNNSPPKFVLMQIQNDEVFMNNITSQQKVMILKLDTEGYNALDLSCLYKVIRNRTLLPKPKQGWGQKPKPEDQSEADDVERMKKHRNDILHRPQGGLSESERNIFFQQSIEIATRVDRRIGSPKNGFESRIKEIKSDIVRIVSPEKYLALIENLAECRDKLREKERPCVILYYANSIAKKIGNQHDQDIKKKDVTVALIKPDVVEAGKVDQMLEDIREAGIEILQHAERMLTEDEIRHKVYGYLENQVFFEDMVQFMTRSPSFVLALTRGKTGKNIIENFRDLIGPTDVEEAKTLKPDSLRAKYGHTSFRNAVHGSSSLETAKRDLQLFFPDFVAPDVEDKAAKLQTTLALVRPKAVVPYKDIILAKIRDSGFKVAMQKEIQMSTEMVEEFYKGHKGQDYYDHLIENMSSGPVLALGLIRENAIEGWRNMLGPKEVSIAQEKAPESLRAQFAVDDAINSLHGSDSEETAKKELQLLFPTEQTVAVIKPDAIRNKDEIVARIHEAGFRIAITTTTKLPEEVAKKFYANCENKDYYIDLIEHMISGEACFIGMCREGAVEGWRSMIGPSDPTKAKKDSPDSIRATYGESILKNAVHGSSDPEHAKRSIKTIFGDRSSSCTIFLRDLDFDDEAVMQIKKKTLGNICTEDIKLIGIEQGSLILHVRIPDWCFMTTEILHERIHTFLHQFFLVASIPFMHGHIFTVVLAESDDLVSDNELTKAEDLDYLRENTLPILKLNVNIQDSVFQDEFVMHREVNRFFFRMYNAIDAHNIPVNGSAKEVLMLAANENGENFASNSATILNSQLRTEEQEASKMMTKEPVVNKIMTKEPVVSKMMTEEPVVSKMITEEPVVSKMMAEESMVSKMMARDLVISEERTEEPVVNKMVAEDLVLSEGRTKEPVVNKMVDEEQVCIEMMDKEPVVSKMMTERPVITERMTKEPEFREGNTEEPVVSKMMAVEPVLSVRVTEKPDVNERMTKELGVSERITQEPVVGKKMTAETVLSECFAEESVVSERMTEEPEVIETFVRMAQKAIEPVADLKMAQEPIVGEMESNYFRISKLFESAPRAVRIKFDDTFPPEILKETLHKNITILTNLKDNKSFSQIQWDSMFPRTGDPTSESFDIPLMIHLFRNLDKMVITNQFPPNTDVSVGADLSRIRRYRKDVPNSKDIVFTNAKFTAYWDEIEAAVIRLSGGILKEECDNLKTMAYNVAKRQTDRNNAQAAKRLAQIEDINDDVDRIEKIDHKQNSDDKKDCSRRLIEEWEEEKDRFVPTNAFNFVLEHLDKRVLAVVGNPGMGKSMLLHQTAIHLRDTEDYTIIPCYSPTDIVNSYLKETKQVFILDDVFGRFILVQPYIDRWKQYEIRIERVLERNNSLLLVSCRSQVFKEKQCESLIIFSKRVCDLNDVECSIDSQQKLEIADQYLYQKTLSEVKPHLNNFDMFPLLCRLYKDRENWNSVSFFQDPFNCYKEELDNFYKEDGGIKCCSLFLCVIHNGCFNQKILMEESESDFSQTLETIFENFKLNPKMNPQRILDSLDTLLNTYLIKRNGQFHVLHDRLFDFLCAYFGKHYQHLIINYADSDIIRDRTLFKSLQTCPQEFTILIDTEYENEYIERLIRDMLSGYIDDVLYNQQIRYEDFRNKLCTHLKKLDNKNDVRVTRVLSEFVMDENVKTSKLLPVNFACKYGYTELFTFFLSKTKDVNAYDGNNIPLITACRKGDINMTGLILEKGADVNQKDFLGCSPLLWSCVYGKLDIIQMLLHKNADIENIDLHSMSNPLMWACFGHFLKYCESDDLIKKITSSFDANEILSLAVKNINDQFCSHEHQVEFFLKILLDGYLEGCIFAEEKLLLNKPPELLSAMQKMLKIINGEEIDINDDARSITNIPTQPFIEIMNLFLERGVDIDKPSKAGITALSFACKVGIYKGSQSISYLLSKGARVNISDKDGIFPLHIAIYSQREDLVKLLIKNGAVVNCSSNELSPIVEAFSRENISIIEILIKNGAHLNHQLENGTNLLHLVTRFNNVELLNTLLKEGISVNCKSNSGDTPLMFAVDHELPNIVNVLIKEGASVNIRTSYQITPLMHALDKQNIVIADTLIQHGADINPHLENGSTLLHYVIRFNNADLINTLIKAGLSVNCKNGQGNTPLMNAVDDGLEEICVLLIKEGANVNAWNSEYVTPLMHAVHTQNISIVNALIKHEADANIRFRCGSTLLHHAIQFNNTDLINTLVKAGLSVNCEDGIGDTPLVAAVHHGLEKILLILIKEGANVNTWNSEKVTPLMYAVHIQNISIVNTLIERKADINVCFRGGSTLLHYAIKFNNTDLLNTLLKAGISVNCEDGQGNTPLMNAVIHGLEEICVLLIKEGANVNAWNSDNVTPLMRAVQIQNISIINILIKHKADINVCFRGGSTLLYQAIKFHNTELINTLVKAGISVNCQDGQRNTPLMNAVIYGLEEICVLLIKEGANVNTWNSEKVTPLMHAVHAQNIPIVNILIKHKADINVCFEKNGFTLLHYAIKSNNTDLINALLKTGISVNCKDGQGNTPLMIAAHHSLARIAGILIKAGAKVDTYNYDGVSLLLIASRNGAFDIVKKILTKKVQFQIYEAIGVLFSACINDQQEIVSFLLQNNFDINMRKFNGNSCLLEASDKGLETMVSLLLEHGANVDASNYSRETPLIVASNKGHTAIVKLLITGKADMYKLNIDGESSIILACLHNHLEVVKVLIENGCNIESFEKKTNQTCLSVASYHAYEKIVTYLIEQGANVNTQSYIGNTPLMLAASKGHLNIVQILIEHKADVNIPNEKGSTSLSLASSKGFDQIVACLIEHGANVKTQSCIGTTPLILAASKGHLNIVKKLIENKADVNSQNDKGSTCLSVASSKGFDNIMTYLIDQRASIDTANSTGDSPLMLASKNGHVSTVKILLGNGAKVNIINKEGLSSLDLARKGKHAEIADVLCEFI